MVRSTGNLSSNQNNMTRYLGRNEILNTKDNEFSSVAFSLLWHASLRRGRCLVNVAGIG